MKDVMVEVLGETNPSEKKKKGNWYSHSAEYWKSVDATVNGVLGGFGYISETDLNGSKKLLTQLFPSLPPNAAVVDCGAGIGRISSGLLQNVFGVVDLVEPDVRYLEKAKQSIVENKLGEAYCCGLQSFDPTPSRYTCVWVQWVLNYLTDDDLVLLFKRFAQSLVEGGAVVVKENVSKSKFLLDRDDSSVTRPDSHFRKLFKDSQLEIAQTYEEEGFPANLLPVRVYVLKPKPKTQPTQQQATPTTTSTSTTASTTTGGN
jgi:protein N-terminal methyltransferase